jgi:hypothetical protein
VKGSSQIFIKTYFFLAALPWISSCAEKTPEGILSKQEMVQIMEELYIAEEKLNHLSLSRDSSKRIFTEIEAMVFENAAVEDSVFRRSFDYYMEHPKEMELIYTALVDTLQLREQRAPFRPDQQ